MQLISFSHREAHCDKRAGRLYFVGALWHIQKQPEDIQNGGFSRTFDFVAAKQVLLANRMARQVNQK